MEKNLEELEDELSEKLDNLNNRIIFAKLQIEQGMGTRIALEQAQLICKELKLNEVSDLDRGCSRSENI